MGNFQNKGLFRVLLVGYFEQDNSVLDVVLPEIRFSKTFSDTFDDAFEICGRNEFDLVFVEFSVPELEMADYITNIRENHLNPDIPIIAVVDSEVKAVSARTKCSCDEAIVKPLDSKRLSRMIWRCLDSSKTDSDKDHRRLLSFVEGNPAYYSDVEAFVQRLPEQIDDIRTVFDSQSLNDLAARILANLKEGTETESPEGQSFDSQIDDIFRELDKMAQACLTAQFKTDCSKSDGPS